MTEALEGLMQDDFPLNLHHIRRRMRDVHPDAEVVTLTAPGTVQRATFGEISGRVDRLARVLGKLGVEPGDRVGTFAWNNQRHFELYMAVPCVGAVLHTLNVRLFEEQLTYIVNHADDKVIFVDDSLVPLLEKLAPSFQNVAALCGDGVDSPVGFNPDESAAILPAERAALRGAAGSGGIGDGGVRAIRLPRGRRASGGRSVLHERHDRQPEGRALLAPLDQPALDGDADEGRARPVERRQGAGGRADVPRQRLGAAARRGARRGRPDPAGSLLCRPSRWRS